MPIHRDLKPGVACALEVAENQLQDSATGTNTNALSHVTLLSIQREMLHCVQHDKKSVILSASEESHSF